MLYFIFCFSFPFFFSHASRTKLNIYIYKYTLFYIRSNRIEENALDRDILPAYTSECFKNCVFRRNSQTNSIIVVIRNSHIITIISTIKVIIIQMIQISKNLSARKYRK